MLKILKILKVYLEKISFILAPGLKQKSFQYGTVSFGISCKLTPLESWFFKVDTYLEKKMKQMEYIPPIKYVFKSFFDQSLGLMITSSMEKREIEQNYNVTYMSNDERKAIIKEAKRNIAEGKKRKYRKAGNDILTNIQQGHSYIESLKRQVNG